MAHRNSREMRKRKKARARERQLDKSIVLGLRTGMGAKQVAALAANDLAIDPETGDLRPGLTSALEDLQRRLATQFKLPLAVMLGDAHGATSIGEFYSFYDRLREHQAAARARIATTFKMRTAWNQPWLIHRHGWWPIRTPANTLSPESIGSHWQPHVWPLFGAGQTSWWSADGTWPGGLPCVEIAHSHHRVLRMPDGSLVEQSRVLGRHAERLMIVGKWTDEAGVVHVRNLSNTSRMHVMPACNKRVVTHYATSRDAPPIAEVRAASVYLNAEVIAPDEVRRSAFSGDPDYGPVGVGDNEEPARPRSTCSGIMYEGAPREQFVIGSEQTVTCERCFTIIERALLARAGDMPLRKSAA